MIDVFLTDRFFLLFFCCAAFFALSFPLPILYLPAWGVLLISTGLVVQDLLVLFNRVKGVNAHRETPRLLSLGESNEIRVTFRNPSPVALRVHFIDELPVRLQRRDFGIDLELPAGSEKQIAYRLRPLDRGEYDFGDLLLYARTSFGLVDRRIRVSAGKMVPVYPSILQMKRFAYRALERTASSEGIRRLRRIGHSYEFDQIRNYVRGDDYRSINWKATGRRNTLMVNQYEDERSQQVYCLIDNSRAMKMPFGGLSLLDHAVNSSLVVANIALRRADKAGILTFSDRIGEVVPADRRRDQLNRILQALYHIQDHSLEANYELLYHRFRQLVRHRSLLLLYTNFESLYALERVLPILRKLNHFHLLVVIFFENTEITEFAYQTLDNRSGIYQQGVARRFILEKKQIASRLHQHGIQTILTRPDELSLESVNKYLELKAKGLI